MRLAPLNNLPAKPEYISKVKKALSGKNALSEKEMIDRTGMTKTQVQCALEAMFRDNLVERNPNDKKFNLIN